VFGHDWPRNVRELENTIQRAVILSDGLAVRRTVIAIEPITTAAERQ